MVTIARRADRVAATLDRRFGAPQGGMALIRVSPAQTHFVLRHRQTGKK